MLPLLTGGKWDYWVAKHRILLCYLENTQLLLGVVKTSGPDFIITSRLSYLTLHKTFISVPKTLILLVLLLLFPVTNSVACDSLLLLVLLLLPSSFCFFLLYPDSFAFYFRHFLILLPFLLLFTITDSLIFALVIF